MPFKPGTSFHPPVPHQNRGSGDLDSYVFNIPSPTPTIGLTTNPQSSRSRQWQGQLCSSFGWLSCAHRLTTSPPSSTCRPTSWGSPPVTPCSDCVAAHHGKWRRLPVKHVSYQGDTGLSPCQVIGLHGIRRVYVPYQSAGAQIMLMLGLWRVSSPPATPSPPPERL